jgi:hypothetical protein
MIPMLISAFENVAQSAAIAMCVASTNSQPPPNAKPFTAAMTGFGKDSIRRVIRWPGRMKFAIASGAPARMWSWKAAMSGLR